MTRPASAPPSWRHAADEIRAEARIRGDLDERTVEALAAHLGRLDDGLSESNLSRDVRRALGLPARPGRTPG